MPAIFVEYSRGVIYEIMLSCCKVYIGQTAQCINDCLRVLVLSTTHGTCSHLPCHCKSCMCEPVLTGTQTLKQCCDTVARDLAYAYFIKKQDDSCVSHLLCSPAMNLASWEIAFDYTSIEAFLSCLSGHVQHLHMMSASYWK